MTCTRTQARESRYSPLFLKGAWTGDMEALGENVDSKA